MLSSLPDLASLLPSWQLALRAERKSRQTVDAYTTGVRLFLRWCADSGTTPELTKAAVQAFTAALLDSGAQAATARSRHMALRRYATWLTDESELDANPLLGVKPPKLDAKVTDALTDDQLKRLIKACQGKDLLDRRDEAIVRLMGETGLRAGELVGMQFSDVNVQDGLATVRRRQGQGGAVRAADRRRHRSVHACQAHTPARRNRTAVARWRWADFRIPRVEYGAEASRPGRQHRSVPPASAAFHRRHTVASGGRVRAGPDGCCRVVHPLDARPIHRSHSVGTRCGRGTFAEPRGTVNEEDRIQWGPAELPSCMTSAEDSLAAADSAMAIPPAIGAPSRACRSVHPRSNIHSD